MSCNPSLPFASKLEFVAGSDCAGTAAYLDKPTAPSLLYAPDGSVAARWADGSDLRPIKLPGMAEKTIGARGPLVQDSLGRIYRLIPANTNDQQVLTWNAGAAVWKSLGSANTIFNPSDLTDAGNCGVPNIAAFTQCTTNRWTLAKLTAQQLAQILFSAEVTGACQNIPLYDSVTDGDVVKPLVCAGGNIRAQDASVPRLSFLPLDTPQSIATITATGTLSRTLNNFPVSTGKIFAVITADMQSASSSMDIAVTFNGFKTAAMGDFVVAMSDNLIPVTVAAQSIVTSGTVSSGSFALVLTLKGYFY